jgi:glycosyltransferase domain-containing protein
MGSELTLVVPTHNRHTFLSRVLEYFSSAQFPILVADSSEYLFPEECRFGIGYFHYSGSLFVTKLVDVFEKVKTTYVVICADDDFIVPESLERCVRFLNHNPGYSSVQGQYVTYRNSGRIPMRPAYTHAIGLDTAADSPAERLKTQFGRYMHQSYSVHRTDTLKTFFQDMRSINLVNPTNLLEIGIAMYGAIRGGHKVLPIFYGAREVIRTSYGSTTDDLERIVSSESHRDEYAAFRGAAARFLASTHNMGMTEANRIISDTMEIYLSWDRDARRSLSGLIARAKRGLEGLIPALTGKDRADKIADAMDAIVSEIISHRFKGIPGLPIGDAEAKAQWETMKALIKRHKAR